MEKRDFFDEHKALIITILIFAILLLTMYNINISNANQKVRETLIQLNELQPEEPEEPEQQEEQVEEPPTPPESRPNLETHQAFNQNQQESQQNVETRLDEIFKKNSAQQEAAEEESANEASGEINLPTSRREPPKKASEGNNTSEEISTREGSIRNSSISYSLIGRTAVNIPNPIYTCDRSGKVVVNITVNALGNVTDTSINKAASTTGNQCLTDRALEYASSAKFSRLAGRDSQPGTITYNFQN